MKYFVFILSFLALAIPSAAKDAAQKQTPQKQIMLSAPQTDAGLPVMKALSLRKSTREFSKKELDNQTISNLLWAALGINRPDGKRTAPSAMNRQEIDVYICLKDGAYFYNAKQNSLLEVNNKDCRVINSPATLFIVANAKPDNTWAFIDGGIVSQNISVFASGMGLVTVPRASMPDGIKETLKLTSEQTIILNHPVGYPKEESK